jgi:riboflavin synthase
MFTGIVEAMGKVTGLREENTNLHIKLDCPFVQELKIDQSVSHNGVCLTVVELSEADYTVTAVKETLERTNLGNLKLGDRVNLERCMPANGRFDGHIVQGHVDCTATLEKIVDANGSWALWFSYVPNAGMTVEKGSICVNGISLTVVDSADGKFSVVIIPYTMQHTNLGELIEGNIVNIEFDILGKYILKAINQRS